MGEIQVVGNGEDIERGGGAASVRRSDVSGCGECCGVLKDRVVDRPCPCFPGYNYCRATVIATFIVGFLMAVSLIVIVALGPATVHKEMVATLLLFAVIWVFALTIGSVIDWRNREMYEEIAS